MGPYLPQAQKTSETEMGAAADLNNSVCFQLYLYISLLGDFAFKQIFVIKIIDKLYGARTSATHIL